MLTKVKTMPAPDPLPSTWARAVANSITTEFRRPKGKHKNPGWMKTDSLRTWHPTGNPIGHALKTTSTVNQSDLLNTTELIESTLFIEGTINPADHPLLNLPPIAWCITELQAAAALTDTPELREPLNRLMHPSRRDLPFRERLNRHGNPTMSAGDLTTTEERNAISIVAAAAQIVTIDTIDYVDAIAEDFDAALTLQLLLPQLA